MKTNLLQKFFYTFILGLISISNVNAQQNCDWIVSGSITTAQELGAMIDLLDTQPFAGRLSGVKVRVRLSRNGTGSWRLLDAVTANSSGEFSVTGTRRCNRQYAAQVQVQFSDNTMSILGPNGLNGMPSQPWYEVFSDINSDVTRARGESALGDIIIPVAPQADLDSLNTTAAFLLSRQAQIWTIYRLFLNRLDSFGARFSYPGRLTVKYPHNNIFIRNKEASFANPLTGRINVVRTNTSGGLRDFFSIGTLYHEAFHIWAYSNFGTILDMQAGLDETCLVRDLFQTGDTHDLNASPLIRQNVSRCSAFHEGFAEAASDAMRDSLFVRDPGLPLSRPTMLAGSGGLRGDRLTNADLLTRHDIGWQTILKTIMLDDLGEFDFGRATANGFPVRFSIGNDKATLANPNGMTACPELGLTLRNVLRLFMPASNRGVPDLLRTNDLTFPLFLRRANMIFPNRMRGVKLSAVFSAITPNSTTNPRDFICN